MGKKIENIAKKKIFFNFATIGYMNKSAYKAATIFLKEYMKLGPPEVLEKYDCSTKKLSYELAKLLNCDKEEITYTKNTTEGIIIASETIPLKAGDEVLIMANEYPANLLPWLKKKKEGIDVKVINGIDNHQIFLKLLDQINPRTKLVSISWGQYYDGYIPDLKLLSKICRENNTYLVVDAVHGIGTRQINLKKVHVDFLSCGGQKSLGALPGIGFLYVNKKTIKDLLDFKIGVRSVDTFDSENYELKKTAERFQDGTQNLIGIVSLHAAIKYVNDEGIKMLEEKSLNLLNIYKNILRENKIDFIDYKDQANILSLKVKDPHNLYLFLRERGIYIKAVKDIARISFSPDSNVHDFLIAIKYIKEWIKQTKDISDEKLVLKEVNKSKINA